MKRTRSQTQTPGGNRLRALRDDCGRTQLDVELNASLGIGYLQRVESGKVRYPERDTLERILAALGAHYSERAEILELFGYVVDTPLPNEAEIRRAVEICGAELRDAVFPMYLLDCANHLLAWNGCFAKFVRDRPRGGAAVDGAADVRPRLRDHGADREPGRVFPGANSRAALSDAPVSRRSVV